MWKIMKATWSNFLDTADGVSVTFTYLDTQKFSLPRPCDYLRAHSRMISHWVGRTEVWGSQLRKRHVLSTGEGFAFRKTSKYFSDVFSKPYVTIPAHYLATQCSSLPFPDSTFPVVFSVPTSTLWPALNPCVSTKHPAWLEWHLV